MLVKGWFSLLYLIAAIIAAPCAIAVSGSIDVLRILPGKILLNNFLRCKLFENPPIKTISAIWFKFNLDYFKISNTGYTHL